MSILWTCIVHESEDVLKRIPVYCNSAMSGSTKPDKLIFVDSDSSNKVRHAIKETGVGAVHIGYSPYGRNRGFHPSFNRAVQIAFDEGFEWLANMTVRAIPQGDWLSSALAAANRSDKIGMVTTLHELQESQGTIHSFGHYLSHSGACLDFGKGLELSQIQKLDGESLAQLDKSIWAPCSGGALYSVEALRACARTFNGEGSSLLHESTFMSYNCAIWGFLMRAVGFTNSLAVDALCLRSQIGSSSYKPKTPVEECNQEMNRLGVVYSFWPPEMANEATRLYLQNRDREKFNKVDKNIITTLAENLYRSWQHKETIRKPLRVHLECFPDTLAWHSKKVCPGQDQGY